MQDYNNLSNKSKELREYRKAYVKKTIRKHALEILGGIVLFFVIIISFFVEPVSTFVKTQKRRVVYRFLKRSWFKMELLRLQIMLIF